MKNIEDIKIIDGVAVLEGVIRNEEIQMVYEYAKAHNIEKYVALTDSGGRYASSVTNGGNRLLGEGEFGINSHYVPPLEAEQLIEEALEEVKELAERAEDAPDDKDKIIQDLKRENKLLKEELKEAKTITLDKIAAYIVYKGYELLIK